MSAILPGYNYDIFISYRQKDNKHDGWVTQFVDNLKGELEATFKEEISVYFDINPHDGLLETHDVDESLKEKLKCLIFIPIISRTYCDPRSYAWEHELKAFVEMASKDQFGLKVKLPNGNVASRVLPVRIHDLSPADIKSCESVLGSVLRGIEFIYREAGVNRPLTTEDELNQNLNKTKYRNQINKVALAINDIISSLQNPENIRPAEIQDYEKVKNKKYFKLSNRKMIVIIAGVSIIFALFIVVPNIRKPSIGKSIAVLPFYNDTPGDSSGFLNGLMAEIYDNLRTIEGFNIPSRTSSSQFETYRPSMPEIGRKLKVNYVVEGSGHKNGKEVIIRIDLYRAGKDEHLWGKRFEEEINNVHDYRKISSQVVNSIARTLSIRISSEEQRVIENIPTQSLDALDYYRRGIYYYWKAGESGETDIAIDLFRKAIAYDPEFALAYTGLANAYIDQYFWYRDRSEDVLIKSKQAIDSALRINPEFTDAHLALGNYYYVKLMFKEALSEFKPIVESEPKNPEANFWTACAYRRSGQWDIAKSLFSNAVRLKPQKTEFIIDLAQTFSYLREYDSSEYYFKKAIALQPDRLDLYSEYADMILSSTGDVSKADLIITDAMRNENALNDQGMAYYKVKIDVLKGNYSGALEDLSLVKADSLSNFIMYKPKFLFYAEIYSLTGENDLARSYYDSSKVILEALVKKNPDDHRFWSSLGLAYAGLGMEKEAVAACEKAIDILPPEKDSIKGVLNVAFLAEVYMKSGRYEKAAEQVKKLLAMPGTMTVRLLESDPVWKNFRNYPEFSSIK